MMGLRHDQDTAVAAVTVADEAWSALLADLLGRVAECFPRRETRQCCGQMVCGLLMELDDHNCWAVAEAVGHRGPHRLQHLLSRAVWDDEQVLDIASARWRIEEDHQLSKQVAGLDAGQVIRWKSWHRWTAVCLLAYLYLAVTVALQRQQEASSDLDAGLIPVTIPELLRLLRDVVIPPPRRDRTHRLHWSACDAATSTAPARPTSAGTPTPRQHHDHDFRSQLSWQVPVLLPGDMPGRLRPWFLVCLS